jgi:hypothetical protein
MEIKAIGGLFETHRKLEQALEALWVRGYAHAAYSIVGTAVPMPLPALPMNRSKGLLRALSRLGLGGEQANYYVDGIQQGCILLVLHGIEASRLGEVRHVLQQHGARFAP